MIAWLHPLHAFGEYAATFTAGGPPAPPPDQPTLPPDHAVLVTVPPALIAGYCAEWQQHVVALSHAGARRFVADCARTSRIDYMGFVALAWATAYARDCGGWFRVSHLRRDQLLDLESYHFAAFVDLLPPEVEA